MLFLATTLVSVVHKYADERKLEAFSSLPQSLCLSLYFGSGKNRKQSLIIVAHQNDNEPFMVEFFFWKKNSSFAFLIAKSTSVVHKYADEIAFTLFSSLSEALLL